MLILLPPSEAKAAPRRRGHPVDLESLPFPELAPTRLAVRAALVEASGRRDALQLLDVGASLEPEVRLNLALPTLPGAAASSVYTGVLYDALDYGSLSAPAKRRAGRSLRVQSALWGPVGPTDRIAPYRLSMGIALPRLGPVAAVWRPVLASPMAALAGTGVVVDCRSAPYAAAWLPTGEAAHQLVSIRVLTEVAGRLTVVSHLAKHTRGLVARQLLEVASADHHAPPGGRRCGDDLPVRAHRPRPTRSTARRAPLLRRPGILSAVVDTTWTGRWP